MNQIGDNNPPDMTVTADETAAALSKWMEDHPAVETEESAREAKVFMDRGKLCLKDLDDERDAKVRPLNTQVKEINEHYRPAKTVLTTIVTEINRRFTAFRLGAARKRVAAAQEAQRLAAQALADAREKERLEKEAFEASQTGEVGVDIKTATKEADAAFDQFKRLDRAAQRAERDTHVKVGGGYGRAATLKTKETLIVVDAVAALKEMGLNDDLRDAFCRSARAYRKITDDLPPGIVAEYDRTV